MKKHITSKLIIQSLAIGVCSLILWSWYQGRGPDQVAKTPIKTESSVKPKNEISSVEVPAQAIQPKIRHVVIQPAGAVKVPKVTAAAPDAVKNFRNWAESYFAAEPADRSRLISQGKELADLHRVAMKQTISNDPKLALELAVPMVVRQDLPDEIEQRLESRVNDRGKLMVLGVVPESTAETVEKTGSVRHLFEPETAGAGNFYNTHLYGSRTKMRSRHSARVSGVAVDGELAVLDSPVRVLEVGERPDPEKPTVEVCPVSGKTTPIEKSANGQAAPVAAKATVVEDNRKIYILCASGHIGLFGDQLTQEETDSHWGKKTLAEGGTGGGATPFDVPGGWTTGTKKLLYLRVAFPDIMRDPQTEASCYENLRKATEYYMTSSYGQFYLTPTVTPLIVLPYPRSWYENLANGEFVLRDHALTVAARMGYDSTSYDLDVVQYEGGPGSFGGLGYVGGRGVWLKTSSVAVLTHELGHNLGLYHANYWMTDKPTLTGPGLNREYGNKFDVMGSTGGAVMGPMVSVHKSILGWLSPGAIHQVTTNGTYRIYQGDQDRADADKRYALSVKMDSERDYWFEFRQTHVTNPTFMNGLMVNWSAWGSGSENDQAFGSNGGAQLLDMTPGSRPISLTGSDTRDDAGLVIGHTYSDTAADLHITPIFKSDTGKDQSAIPYMDVVVNRGPFAGNQKPNLTLEATARAIKLSESITFTATGVDGQGDKLAYAWDFGDKSYSVNNSRIQKKQWAEPGRYQVLCVVSDMKGLRTIKSLLVEVQDDATEIVFKPLVSGTITDVNLRPVEGVYVSNYALRTNTSQNESSLFRSTLTDADGKYTLTNLNTAAQLVISPVNYPKFYSTQGQSVYIPTLETDQVGLDWQESSTIPQNVNVSVTQATAAEGGASGIITLTRSTSEETLAVQVMRRSQGTASRDSDLVPDVDSDYTLSWRVPPSLIELPIGQVSNLHNFSELRGCQGVFFAAGQTTIVMTIKPTNDVVKEGAEYAVIDIPDTSYAYTTADADPRRRTPYSVSGQRSAVIAIVDNDTVLPQVKLSIDDPSIGENGDHGTVRVTRDGILTNPLTVSLGYPDDTPPRAGVARSGTDFSAIATIVIPAGLTEAKFNLSAINDPYAEGTESFSVSLNEDITSYVTHNQLKRATFFLLDNDQPTVQVTAPVASCSEASATPAKFLITRSAVDIGNNLVVKYSLGGSALSGSDYRRIEGTAVIPANELSVEIKIVPIADSIDELDQTVVLRLATDAEYAVGLSNEAVVTIKDNNKDQFTIVASSDPVTEPREGLLKSPLFTIERPVAGTVVKVRYEISTKSTATVGQDYILPYEALLRFGEIEFLETDLSKDINLQISPDIVAEPTETIVVKLLPFSSYSLGFESEATVLILDEDSPNVSVSYAERSGSLNNISENPAKRIRFQFWRSRTVGTATVGYTFKGNALRGTDFALADGQIEGQINFLDGASRAFLELDTINDNTPRGTRELTVSINTGGSYGIRIGRASVYIDDDDRYPTTDPVVNFTSVSSSVSEKTKDGKANSTNVTVSLNQEPEAGKDVTVEYRLIGGSATGRGVDYTLDIPVSDRLTPTTGFLKFRKGDSTSRTFKVDTNPDSTPEGDETILFELVNAVGANIGINDEHTVYLQDHAVPEVFTDPIAGPAYDQAMLKGKFLAGNIKTTAYFEWGTSATSLPNITTSTEADGTSFVPMSELLLPLKYPGTYYYRAVATNAAGTSKGIVRMIRTQAPPTVVTTLDAGHTANSITLAGTINPNRGSLRYYFRYGNSPTNLSASPDPNDWFSLPNGTKPVVVTQKITGLREDTILYYQLVAVSDSGLGGTVSGLVQVSTAVPYLTTGNLIVNASASHSTAGEMAWQNLGTSLGNFVAAAPTFVSPNVHGTGLPGVFFDGKTVAYELAPPSFTSPDPNPWAGIIGSENRTIEVWAYNPGYGSPDTLVNMGKDGEDTQVAISHSNLTQPDGAVRHGTVAKNNAAYTAKTLPPLARWNHYAYVYEGAKKPATLYINGVKAVTVPGLTLATSATSLEPITLGASRNASSVLGKFMQGYINSMRIHDGVLKPADVLFNFRVGPSQNKLAAPVAVTTGVSGLTPTSVTLNGSIASIGMPATAWIEWGTSSLKYDNASAAVPVPNSSVPTTVTLSLANLVPGVEYHYRLASENKNSVDISYGQDVTFVPQVLPSAGKLWVDLRAQDFTGEPGSSWMNRGALGAFNAVGTPSFSADVDGTGYPGVQFDGTSSAFESVAKADIDFSYGDDQTLEVWAFNRAIETNETLVNQGRDITPFSRLRLTYSGADDGTSWTPSPAVGAWTHFAVVVSAGTRILYINGVPSGSMTPPAGANQWDDKVLLGAKRNDLGVIDFSTDVFSGFINSVKIHGGAMLPAQITASFNAGPVPKTAAPAVVTTGTNSVGDVYANLVGNIQAGELPTTYKFEWGTTALTNSTPITSVLNTFALNTVFVPISGLAPLTTYQYRLVAVNSRGMVNGAPLTFTTTAVVNDPPVATNATFSGDEGTPISGTATGTDEESDAITAVLVTQAPQSGTLSVIGANGNFSYTPDVGFYGVDRFEFRVVAGGQTSAPGVITLNVTVPAPTALTTNLFTKVSANLDGQVLAKGPIAATNGYTKLTDPNVLHGSITAFNSDTGEFTFEPVTGFVGTANFTFRVTYGSAPSAPATVTIVIGGPEAGSKEFSGFEDDVVADALPTTNDPSLGTLSFSLVATANAKHGVVKINDNGTFTYNPKAGFVGVDRFQFQATNGTTNLVSNPGTVTIIITKRPPNWVWTQGSNLPKSFGVYGRLGVPSAANLPGARGNSVSWAEPDGTLWIFGGQGFAEGKVAGFLNDLWKRDPITKLWTWVSGSNGINAKANYGAQGLSVDTNQPGARSGAVSWLDQDGTLWMFGGTGFDATSAKAGALNDLWSFDPISAEWTWWKGSSIVNANGTYGVRGVSSSTSTPGARQGATAWVDGENTLWLFGGLGQPGTGTASGPLNDLWKYIPSENTWTWVSGESSVNAIGVYGKLEGISSIAIPGARSYASGWVDHKGLLYLYGGNGLGAAPKTVGFLNDLWVYHPESNCWSWIKGSSALGAPSVSGLLGVTNSSNLPSGRAGSMTWISGNQEVWLFGGQTKSGLINDLWRFDLSSKSWTLLKSPTASGLYGSLLVGEAPNTPGARRGSAAYTNNMGDLCLFGGTNAANSFNDLWRLDLLDTIEVQTLDATNVTATSADINAKISVTQSGAFTGFNYWPRGRRFANSDEIVIADFDTEGQINESILDLEPGTQYAFQVYAVVNGIKTYGKIKVFETLGSQPAISVGFSEASDKITEGIGSYSVAVELSAPSSKLVTVPVIPTLAGSPPALGVAEAAKDYGALPTVASFPPGQTRFLIQVPVVNDSLSETDDLLTLTLGTPTPSGTTALGAQNAFALTIEDDDVQPRIEPKDQPRSQFAMLGQKVSFEIISTGERLKYQWKSNDKNIPNATSKTYEFIATMASAANYTCFVSNDVGSTITREAEVFVLDSKPAFRVVESGDVVMSVVAASPPGEKLSYRWRYEGSPETEIIPETGSFIIGTQTSAMTIRNVAPSDSYGYICRVHKFGDSSLAMDSIPQVLSVPDAAPTIPSFSLPPGVVGLPYNYKVVVGPDLRTQPSKFEATLPKGLIINAKTGLITGKPTNAGTTSVFIKASNLTGSVPKNVELRILPLPTGVQGTYVGLIDRAPATMNMGGRVDLTIAPAGTYTLKLNLSGLSASASGSVVPTIDVATVPPTVPNVTGTAEFKRKAGQSNLRLKFTVTSAGEMTADLTDLQTVPLFAPCTGVRLAYSATVNPPNPGDYTMLFDLRDPQVGVLRIPQGNGFATMALAKDGKITGVGRTADGNAFTLATILGADGKMPVFASFTPILGTLHGVPSLVPDIAPNSYINGTVTWNKVAAPSPVRSLLYHEGFSPITMDVLGGRYLPVENGAVVRGLVNNANKAINARLEFSEGGLLTSELDTFVLSITNPAPPVKTTQVIVLPSNNPNKLTFVLPAKPAGSFNGKVDILNSRKDLVRNVTYQGVMAKVSPTEWRAAGFVLVPQLPQPGQTIKTSNVLSGQVVLEPNP